MDIIRTVLDWYMANSVNLTPVLISVFIIGFSLGIVQLLDDKLMRTALIFPVGAVLIIMGFILAGNFGRELYFNLGTEFFTALIALLIVGMVSQFESWATPLGIVALFAFILVLIIDPNNIQSSLSMNFGTGIIGAWLTAFLIRREWSFSPDAREKRMTKAMRATRKERNKQEDMMGDYFMLISGRDEADIQQRIDFLKSNDMLITNESITEQDEETQLYYRLINAKIQTVVKQPESVLLANQEARVQILGYPDSVKKVFKQIDEVLDLGEQKRIEAPDKSMVHIEFKATAPVQPYSAYLEAEIYKLAREWQYGNDEALQLATDSFLNWAKEMNLIKK